MRINVHGGHNTIIPGASGYFSEVTEDRNVKNKVIAKLQALGHTVYDCTDETGNSKSKNLSNIVAKCNAHTVDLDVSIHFNASNGAGHGVEVLIYKSGNAAHPYATNICNAIAELGFRNRGVKVRNNLYVLRHTKSSALLIECCFCDNAEDAALYNAEAMANAIVKGITGQVSNATDNTTVTGGIDVNYQVKVNTKSGVNCRKEASASSEKITAYANGIVLNISKEQNGWGYANNTGWVSLEYCTKVTDSTNIGSSNGNSIVAEGQQHSINFTGVTIATDGIWGSKTKANAIRCVQNAMNLDYGAGLSVDGIWGTKSNKALGNHWVKKGETQYMVTALEILLMLRGYQPNGVECPGQFGSGLEAAVRSYQSAAGLKVDGVAGKDTFKSLMGV